MWAETGIGGRGGPARLVWGPERRVFSLLGCAQLSPWEKDRWPLGNSGGLLQDPQLLRAGEEVDVPQGHCASWIPCKDPILAQKRGWHFSPPGDEQRK